MSKTTLADVKGFTPLIDMLVEEYNGVITAAVFGRVWRYCQGAYGNCQASLQTIADELGMSYATVFRHVKALCEDGYLEDRTPDLRNRPHTYADTGKVTLKVLLKAGLSESKSTLSESKSTLSESKSTLSESKSHSIRKIDEDTTRDNKRKKRREAAAAAKKPKRKPSSKPKTHPLQTDWDSQDHLNFSFVLKNWCKEFGKLRPNEVERMIELWNLFPELDMHEYAWNEMADARDKRDVRPNLVYYRKCLETEARNWVLEDDGGGNGRG